MTEEKSSTVEESSWKHKSVLGTYEYSTKQNTKVTICSHLDSSEWEETGNYEFSIDISNEELKYNISASQIFDPKKWENLFEMSKSILTSSISNYINMIIHRNIFLLPGEAQSVTDIFFESLNTIFPKN